MKVTSDIFQLIKSLSQSEKRHFKLFSSQDKRDKNYLRLFNVIDKQKKYDEEKIKQKFKNENFVKHLSSEKALLQKQILKALRVFHSENRIELQLNALMSDIKILQEKELFELSEKLIVKGIALARKHEQHTQLLQLLICKWDLESNLVRGTANENFKNKLRTNDEIRITIRSIESYLNYMVLHEEAVRSARTKVRVRNAIDKNALDKIMHNPLLKNKPSKDLGTNARFMFHTVHFLYHATNGDVQKAYPHVKEEMALMEKNPEAIYLTPRLFYNVTHNYLYVCLFTRNYEEMKSFMHNYREGYYKKLHIDLSMIENAMEESLLNYALAISIYSKDHALGLQTIADYEKKIDDYEKIISEDHRITVYYKVARILISSAKHKKALVWINKIINESSADVRLDMQCYTRILQLIIHFELGNFDFLETAIGSTKRFLEKKRMLFKTEGAFLNLMKEVLRVSKIKEKQDLFHDFRSQLVKFKNDPYEKNAELYFDFESWVTEKLK